MKKTRIILTIDGGGIRGVIPAVFLKLMEDHLKIKIVNHLDLIVGTSTGGILTAGMITKNNTNEWKYNFSDIIDFYLKDGKKIFYQFNTRYSSTDSIIKKVKKSFYKIYYFIKDLVDDERYSSKPIDTVFKERFGNETLLSANEIPAVMMTGFDMNHQKSILMKSHNNKMGLKLWEAVRITASAPTYFEPYCIDDMVLVDGGLFANDPSMSAYIEIKKLFPNDDFIIISLGTGEGEKKLECKDISSWTDLKWLKPLISSFMNGPNSATQHYLSVLENLDPHLLKYFRFQINTKNFKGDMDDASDENLNKLMSFGENMFYDNLENIEKIMNYINENENIYERTSLYSMVNNKT